ncbi:hypothetical protein SynBIOSE41_02767 [Synechococcus sp. BIOS-E4-1]|nr:hypothetical protein SynBIOSE41_02767 [Synechococcus sp. BIOS-E4-1]
MSISLELTLSCLWQPSADGSRSDSVCSETAVLLECHS